MADMTILVPSRGRPHSVAPIIEAWRETGAFVDGAELTFVIDEDDPRCAEYQEELAENFGGQEASLWIEREWMPMVPKLNRVALPLADAFRHPIGFMGDDHLPRTVGWVKEYLKALEEKPGVVSCPDGFRTDDLPTQWAMSAEVIIALRRMVPAPVDHLYCDNAVRDLAIGADAYSWLPDVLIEHVHPLAGKAELDDGYRTVNSPERYQQDMTSYAIWTYRDADRHVALLRKALHGE